MAHLLCLVWLIFLSPALAFGADFKDVPKSHWAYTSIRQVSDKKLISGFQDGTFRGTNSINRFEIALYLNRLTRYIDSRLSPPMASIKTLEKKSRNIDLQALKSEVHLLKAEIQEIKNMIQNPVPR
ncbi:MAG: hypothetical protein ACI9BD_000920 [Candidatus Marinamargulisbacteria bacterium]|jgi:hypothetical protein